MAHGDGPVGPGVVLSRTGQPMLSPILRSKRYDSAMLKLSCPRLSAPDPADMDKLFFVASP